MADRLVLSFDVGTQSVRGFIFDTEGSLLCSVKREVGEYDAPEPGWAEIDPKRFKVILKEIIAEIKETHPDLMACVAAIAISTMRECFTLVDENGEAVRPTIIWLDRRGTDVVRPKSKLVQGLLKLAGLSKMVTLSAKYSYSNWLHDNEPESWEKASRFTHLPGYLNHWLTGKYQDTPSAQAGHVAFDSKTQNWSTPSDIKYYFFPLEKDKTVELVQPGTVIGTLTKEAAEELGLSENIAVVACGSDKGCETLGCGCSDKHTGVLSFGSQATLETTVDKYYEVESLVPSFAAAVPNAWTPETTIYRGFWMVTWFKHNMAPESIANEPRAEILMEQYLRDTNPGADGLFVYPYFGACLKRPDSSGAMVGLKDYHTRAHIYRAILEGIGYALKEGMLVMEKKNKCRMDYLIASGGGSKSDIICQMMSNITNRPVVRKKISEATGLGAAMTGYVALGEFDSFEAAGEAMSHEKDRFEPNAAEAAVYEELYKAYLKKKSASY